MFKKLKDVVGKACKALGSVVEKVESMGKAVAKRVVRWIRRHAIRFLVIIIAPTVPAWAPVLGALHSLGEGIKALFDADYWRAAWAILKDPDDPGI